MDVMTDPQAAAWLDLSVAGWARTVTWGPLGFECYARLRFIPDPTGPGQQEAYAPGSVDHVPDHEQVRRVLTCLMRWTTTPQDMCVALWEGDPEAAHLGAPAVASYARNYYLLRAGCPG